jgi:hypothetical protein
VWVCEGVWDAYTGLFLSCSPQACLRCKINDEMHLSPASQGLRQRVWGKQGTITVWKKVYFAVRARQDLRVSKCITRRILSQKTRSASPGRRSLVINTFKKRQYSMFAPCGHRSHCQWVWCQGRSC